MYNFPRRFYTIQKSTLELENLYPKDHPSSITYNTPKNSRNTRKGKKIDVVQTQKTLWNFGIFDYTEAKRIINNPWKNTISKLPFGRSGNVARSNAVPVGKIFSVFTVPSRETGTESPPVFDGGQEAEPTLKIPRRCLLSPRDASPSPFLPRLDERKAACPFFFALPSPLRFASREGQGGGGCIETRQQTCILRPSRERERERFFLGTGLARARIRLETGSGHQSLVKPRRLVVEMPTQCPRPLSLFAINFSWNFVRSDRTGFFLYFYPHADFSHSIRRNSSAERVIFCDRGFRNRRRDRRRWSSLQPVETALRFFPRVSSRGYPSIQRREEIFDIFIPVITVNLRSILSEDLLKVFTLLRAVLIIFTRPGSVSFFSFFPFGCIYRG